MPAIYVYEPVLLDRMGQATNLKPGTHVILTQPAGCPRNGTMGQVYVANADDGAFRGMVCKNSLRRAKP